MRGLCPSEEGHCAKTLNAFLGSRLCREPGLPGSKNIKCHLSHGSEPQSVLPSSSIEMLPSV